MDAGEVAVVCLILFGAAGLLLSRHAKRRGRTLPPEITTRLRNMHEAPIPNRTSAAMRVSKVSNPHYKLADLEMDDGRVFRHVWIVEDRWPTLSLPRLLAGSGPDGWCPSERTNPRSRRHHCRSVPHSSATTRRWDAVAPTSD